MQTKTYLASSVPAALEVARKELGAEALLVNSRPAPPEVRALGRLEVTFAFDSTAAPAKMARTFATSSAGNERPSGHHSSRSELDEIREQIAALRSVVGRSGQNATPPGTFDDLLAAAGRSREGDRAAVHPAALNLSSNGLQPETARSVVAGALKTPGDLQSAIERELSGRIPVALWAEIKPGESRTLSFVGPPGRGKTTSLVKIAVQQGLAKRIPVKIYSAGSHCVGGQEQLSRYAVVLGVPFHAFESLESLHLALNGDHWNGLILIDTPGLSPADEAEMSAFLSFFRARPEIEKHLVLRADAGTADMILMASRFSGLSLSRLLFTGLDEASSPGPMIEALIKTGIPATFAGTGQTIPNDMEIANPSGLARKVCAAQLSRAAA